MFNTDLMRLTGRNTNHYNSMLKVTSHYNLFRIQDHLPKDALLAAGTGCRPRGSNKQPSERIRSIDRTHALNLTK